MWALPAQALYITADLEVLRIPSVGAAWQSVSTQNSYTSAVVVCVYDLPSSAANEAVVRLDNVAAGGFDLRIQRPENSSAVTASDVYCLVADEGLHTLPDGRQFEAHRVLSDGTNGLARGWGVGGVNGAEDVSGAILGSYPQSSQPAVLGQVMTYNDVEFSAFWSFDCDNRANVPFQNNIDDGICVGKHVGEISGATGNRANETLGYLIIEEGASPNGAFGGIGYRVDLGGDSIAGVGNSPPYTYGLGAAYEFAVATKEAEDGGQGGWAVLYGTAPLAGNAIDLAIDEETVAGDTTRTHITEQVAYWTFHGVDHGDAPLSYGDASHVVSGVLSIGALAAGDADAETAQYSAAANADDLNLVDDEDGIVFHSSPGHSIFADVEVANRTSGSVTLCAWLDIPSGGSVDGAFSAADGRCQTTSAANPTLTFQWSGLPADQQYATFARFRLTSGAMTTANAVGAFANGEVEDYPVVFDFRPTAVTVGKVDLGGIDVETLLADSSGALLAAYVEQVAQEAGTGNGGRDPEDQLGELVDPDGDGVVALLRWTTLEERGTIGFRVQRRTATADAAWQDVGIGGLLPGLIDAPLGGEYRLLDPQARSGIVYEYRLVELEAWGSQRFYGPYVLWLGSQTDADLSR